MGTSPSYDNRALNIAISSAIYKGFVTQSKFDLPLSNRSMQTFTLKARNPYPHNNIAERDPFLKFDKPATTVYNDDSLLR
jgi:hypothetical protein